MTVPRLEVQGVDDKRLEELEEAVLYRSNSSLHRILQSPKYTPNSDGQIAVERRRMYNITLVVCMILNLIGFIPSTLKYISTGTWWLNPFTAVPEWGNKMDAAMLLHITISFLWIGFMWYQYMYTGLAMLKMPSQSMRLAHKWGGIISIVIAVISSVSAIWYTVLHGTAGKIVFNGFAIAVGSMICLHIVMGVSAIKNKNRYDHIWHMCAVYGWSCIAGLTRVWGFSVQWLLLEEGCDCFYTSGCAGTSYVLVVLFIALLRYALLKVPFRFVDYWLFWVMMAFEFSLGFLDNSVLRCPENPLLAQPPGKPWTLEF